jgi:hypothetical protein
MGVVDARGATVSSPLRVREIESLEFGIVVNASDSFGAALARHPPFFLRCLVPLRRAHIHAQVEKFFESLSGCCLFLGAIGTPRREDVDMPP